MKDFVTYEIAVKLKEKGFDELCLLHYTNEQILVQNSTQSTIGDTIGVDDILDSYNRFNNACTDVPTISQVLKWFREEKIYHVEIIANASGYIYVVSHIPSKGGTDRFFSNYRCTNDGGAWDKWEDCAIDAIEYVLNNLI